jgi:hypothetical protein
MQEYYQAQVGVPAEAIPDALEDLLAAQEAVRRASGPVDGGSDNSVWPCSPAQKMMSSACFSWGNSRHEVVIYYNRAGSQSGR